MIFFAGLIVVFLAFVLSLKEAEVEFSDFEIDRRLKLGEKRFENLKIKKRIVPIFNRARAFLSVFLVAILSLALADIFKFWEAFSLVVVFAAAAFMISRTDFARRFSKNIFKKLTPKLNAIFLSLKSKTQKKILKLGEKPGWMFYSKEEMFDFLGKHKQILAEDELGWFEQISKLQSKTVADLMDDFENLDILHEKDLLTPMIIDELFKSKRDIFAVMDEADEKVLGVVKMTAIGEIGGDSKRVRTVMEREFFEIQSEKNALEAFEKMLKKGENFAIAKNRKGEFAGILYLKEFSKK